VFVIALRNKRRPYFILADVGKPTTQNAKYKLQGSLHLSYKNEGERALPSIGIKS
jgi:hypothetical protein